MCLQLGISSTRLGNKIRPLLKRNFEGLVEDGRCAVHPVSLHPLRSFVARIIAPRQSVATSGAITSRVDPDLCGLRLHFAVPSLITARHVGTPGTRNVQICLY